jgi:hypothetical protein
MGIDNGAGTGEPRSPLENKGCAARPWNGGAIFNQTGGGINMKKHLFILLLALAAALPSPAAEKPEVAKIRAYYNDVLKRIKDQSLYQRDLILAYEVIPGIGAPSSRVRICYDMVEKGEGVLDIAIVRIENYYQHAGNALFEECVFDARGDLVFYFVRRGQGDIRNPGGIEWASDERCYYESGRLVRAMYGKDIRDNPSSVDRTRGSDRMKRALRLRN